MRLGRGHRLRRKLKHGYLLTLAQERQQHSSPIRKFERIDWSILVEDKDDQSPDGELSTNHESPTAFCSPRTAIEGSTTVLSRAARSAPV
jgi:hypothetical protein